ncbi:MAG: type II toxin-antitoxin system HicB family antitoxin [Burkholderiaceae bacterium]
MRYAVIIENAGANYSAYVPDLPGCVTVGETIEEVRTNIKEAMEFHLHGMIRDSDPIPEPSLCEWVEVPVGEPQHQHR